ncbi:MAG: pyridoxamine 5'-phosphate oxidase family protein [Muribaculaceae bacterium]|nr:pyridoxamine 5'-phosphate oxidase family protein [Muribaculaceae bacterium]
MNEDMKFREMRRKRQQLSEEDSISILKNSTAGTLALLGDNGYPYAVPVSYVYADGKLYFHSAQTGHKIDAIKRCEKASFCVIAADDIHPSEFTTYFRSVIAFGKIQIIESEDERIYAASLLGDKYNPGDEAGLHKELEKGLSHMLVLRLDIEHLTGKEAIELVRKK